MAIISFNKTIKELLAGKKTCTRRNWSPRNVSRWQKCFDEGNTEHDAYDKSPRNGGKKIGEFILTERPYYEYLANMPAEDLINEGGMCKSLDDFCKLIDVNLWDRVVVIRFVIMDMET